MTDKERLEGITSRYVNSILNDGYQRDTVTITTKDYLHLIKQAGRVQGLEVYKESYEGVVRALDNMADILIKREEQNKRYREALGKIANKAEVDFGNWYANKAYNHSRFIARKALEESE